jgi:hypothetical protein
MATMKKEDADLIKRLGISEELIFDGTGYKKGECQSYMYDAGYRFVYGISPCKALGHTLRTRSWHCLHCDPAKYAYQERHYNKGYVYIAFSNHLKLIKIGTCSNIKSRNKSLQSQNYGGADDWQISLYTYFEEDAGKIEALVQSELKPYFVSKSYLRDGFKKVSYEIFNYGVEAAWKILKQYKV